MLIDARSLPPRETLHADICIVGAGPAGITLALQFTNQRYSVIVLEGGDIRPSTETQDLYSGIVSGQPYYALETCRIRFLGGSTNNWGGWCRPLDVIDFEE